MNSQLTEYVDNLPNLCGPESQVEEAMRASRGRPVIMVIVRNRELSNAQESGMDNGWFMRAETSCNFFWGRSLGATLPSGSR